MTSYSTMLVSTKLPSDGARELLAIFSLHDYLKHGGMCNKLSQTRTWRSSVSPENVSIHLHPRYQVRVWHVCYSVQVKYSFSGKCSLSCCDIKFRHWAFLFFQSHFPLTEPKWQRVSRQFQNRGLFGVAFSQRQISNWRAKGKAGRLPHSVGKIDLDRYERSYPLVRH